MTRKRLGGLAVLAAVALVFFATSQPAESTGALPEESLLLTACTTARQVAILGKVNVERCRLVAMHDEGQTALVTVKVKVTGQGWFAVALAYQRSVWTQSAISITGAG